MSLFNRIVNVKIISNQIDNFESDLEINISGLKVSYNITKTESPDGNNGTVTIYNLSENSRNLIKSIDDKLELLVGYEESGVLETILKGNISSFNHNFSKPNIITTLEVGDGEKILQESKISLSYSGRVSMRNILKDVVSKFGFDQKLKFDLLNIKDKILNNGFSFSGLSKTVMDKLTKSMGLQWSIQNDELKIYSNDETDTYTLINLSSNTGLIGSPIKSKIKKGKKDDQKDVDGWKVTSLLQPKAEPGGRVIIDSKVLPINSEFKIINVTHNGDNRNGSNITIMEVIEL